MEDYTISKDYLDSSTTEELIAINQYLLSRHKYLMQYEYYNRVAVLADSMDEIETVILGRLSQPKTTISTFYQP